MATKITTQDIFHLLSHELGAPCEFDNSGYIRHYMANYCSNTCPHIYRREDIDYSMCWKRYFKGLKAFENDMPDSEKSLGITISNWAMEQIGVVQEASGFSEEIQWTKGNDGDTND